MESNLSLPEERWMGIVALLSALLLAASELSSNGISELFHHYAYWLVRILIESSLFVAVLYAIEKKFIQTIPRVYIYILSILLSLVPFTLAITSFDLILGLPELGLNETSNNTPTTSRVQEFGLELIYLFDNHAILCTLLLLPRLLWPEITQKENNSNITEQQESTISLTSTLVERTTPAIKGSIYHIEAQEHYIRIVTPHESRMILYRFSDAIREMPSSLGMQVHRSHWVAYNAVTGLIKDKQNLKIILTDNETVPVSRSFRTQVEGRFSEEGLTTS